MLLLLGVVHGLTRRAVNDAAVMMMRMMMTNNGGMRGGGGDGCDGMMMRCLCCCHCRGGGTSSDPPLPLLGIEDKSSVGKLQGLLVSHGRLFALLEEAVAVALGVDPVAKAGVVLRDDE